jgi:hypothetical protein
VMQVPSGLRAIPRSAWRHMSRAQRIIAREHSKAFCDAVIYGSGFVRMGDLGTWKRDGSDVAQYVSAAQMTKTTP